MSMTSCLYSPSNNKKFAEGLEIELEITAVGKIKKQINTLQHVKHLDKSKTQENSKHLQIWNPYTLTQSATIISQCKTFYLKQSQNFRYRCFTGSKNTQHISVQLPKAT